MFMVQLLTHRRFQGQQIGPPTYDKNGRFFHCMNQDKRNDRTM